MLSRFVFVRAGMVDTDNLDSQSSLFQVINLLVRAGPESREQVLHYFGHVISINVKRAGSHVRIRPVLVGDTHLIAFQVDHRTVATDGFLVNLQVVLLKLAEPFMDAQFSKISRIDVDFLGRSTRLNLAEETRINATSDDVKQYSETAEPSPGGA